MGLLIGFLTVLLVISCILLMFLILLQLPKKEAGAGMAFGTTTADTLFGAGSGNVLTKLTKYIAGAFLALTLLLAVLENHQARGSTKGLGDALKQKESTMVIPPAQPAALPAPTTPALQVSSTLTNTTPVQAKPAPAPAIPAPTVPPPAKTK